MKSYFFRTNPIPLSENARTTGTQQPKPVESARFSENSSIIGSIGLPKFIPDVSLKTMISVQNAVNAIGEFDMD